MGLEKKSHQIGGYSKYYLFYPTPFPSFHLFKYFSQFCSLASVHDHLAIVISPRVGHVT